MKIMPLILTLLLAVGLSGCTPDTEIPTPRPPVENPGGGGGGEGDSDQPENPQQPPQTTLTMKVTIDSSVFTVTLEESAAARAFQARLPMSITMGELNGNEKYYYLPDPLPTSATTPGTIRSGDLMLFGSDCLVLFYKSFSTPYSYTRIGSIDHPSGLAAAVGGGNIVVKFEQS